MDLRLKSPSPTSESHCEAGSGGNYFDYSQRAQWLRAIVLGGNEGLVSSTIFVMGMGLVTKETSKDLMVTGLLGLAAGALTIFTAEFVSVCTQVDIVDSQNDRDQRNGQNTKAPSPIQIAVAASVAYLVGGVVPILTAFAVGDLKRRIYAVAALASLAMLVVGNIGASLGKAPVVRSCARVIMGGWIEISILIGKFKVIEYYTVSK